MPKCKAYINLVLNRWKRIVDQTDREEWCSNTRKNYSNRSNITPSLCFPSQTLSQGLHSHKAAQGGALRPGLHGLQDSQGPGPPGSLLSPSQRRSCQQNLLEQGLVDCSLSITARIISILHSALCTVLGKSNTLKG